ncbi:MAG: GTPase Era [Betaproteobacteria bacterium]|nr:GTPase Era [Betaproteobacteria bacterium]
MSGARPQEPFRCGAAAVIGRPNVGKSTLINALVGAKISITSRKPQTTRHRIRGVLTTDDAQYVFVDTPGFQTEHRNALNRMMNRGLAQAIAEVDCVLLVLEAGHSDEADARLVKLAGEGTPVLAVVNKIDRIGRAELLPFLERLGREPRFAEIVPVSAERRRGLAELLRALRKYLPEREALFPEDELTDRSERFLAAELLREKLFRLLGDELPYAASVVIDKYEEGPKLRRICASIVVEKDGHKAIVIGSGGEKLKRIATEARLEMEKLFGGKVHLQVWVKARRGWTDDERALKRLGYE